MIVRDTGIKTEYIKELEKTNAELNAELKELTSQVVVIKARQVSKTEEEKDEPMEKIREQCKEAKDLVEALKIENELTKKTLALLSL